MLIEDELKKSNVSTATIKNWERLWIENLWEKLSSRANKRFSTKRIIPEQYIQYSNIINELYGYYEDGFSIKEIIFSLVLNLTRETENKFLEAELKWWEIAPDRLIGELLNKKIVYQWDLLWGVYQSLLDEWERNIKGCYYTPDYVVKDIIDKWYKDGMNFLDPCCWTGQFLLQIQTNSPEKIWGIDIDRIAVSIARINLMMKYSGIDFLPNIYCTDSLIKKTSILEDGYFDMIWTNPPWWAKMDIKYEWYPLLKSGEIFSYFIQRWIELLKKWGILSYILPESILNVKVHEDIRWILLKYDVVSIYELWRIFTWVFTSAIRLDIKKQDEDGNIEIFSKKTYIIEKSLFLKNTNYTFSIHMDNNNSDLLEKIYSRKAHYLTNENTEWALWIVTWSNKDFISDKEATWYIPIYTWKEVYPYLLGKPKKYLLYTPEKFQQIAPINRYEAAPKLIYKFISKKLVFSLDYDSSFTLNSANIIIPKINYPIKVIAALFNSDLYQTIFQKKFNSIKVLKSHIQELPLPLFKEDEIIFIEKIVDEMMVTKNLSKKNELDAFIFDILTK